ncbi:unnamed protein product [Notodromas monacha]|uniref:Basement membrane-specific heparan sulfate proteoglycan core protein n=1 Tax=Notodromas monacha TaxID=399045 RepID=A0A7R9BU34_9CRUS|nr:unnamed protein product [Notodromas monacha]CAG0921774.1 unnamed protein product [Notodromas monacha]
MTVSQVYFLQPEGAVLRITTVLVRDRGMYECSAENAGGVAKGYGLLEVERREAPVIEMNPAATQNTIDGASVLFQCRVTAGIPTPRIIWKRADGSPLPTNSEVLQGGVLRFNQVQGPEQGQYLCTAENVAGSTSAIATLNIQGRPVVEILNDKPLMTAEGSRVALLCRASGNPPPTVSWRRYDGGPLYSQGSAGGAPQSAQYMIERVTREDEGVYVCSARNQAGEAEDRLNLIVERAQRPELPNMPPYRPEETLRIDQPVFVVLHGHRAEMTCNIIADDSPGVKYTINWRRADGKQMNRNHRIVNGTLYIEEVLRDDQGVYECYVLNNGVESKAAVRCRLEVLAPPSVDLVPSKQTVRPGDDASISCVARGDEPIKKQWTRTDGVMSSRVKTANGRIMFRGIQLGDAGKYVCTASNAAGVAEGIAEVIVNEQVPFISADQNNVRTYVGSTATLKCNVARLDNAYLVDWSRQSLSLPRSAIIDGPTMRLRSVQISDSGVYICSIRDPETGRESTDSIRLEVEQISNIAIRITPSQSIIRQGDDMEVSCSVSGDPLATVTWSKDGQMASNVKVENNRFIIDNVRLENGGIYRCTATTNAGTFHEDYLLAIQCKYDFVARKLDPRSAFKFLNDLNYFLQVHFFPTSATPEFPMDAEQLSVQTRSSPYGAKVALDCKTSLEPPVAYVWSKQDGPLPKHSVNSGSRLTIQFVKAEDAGTYVCTARSNGMTVDIPTILVVTGVVPFFVQAPLSYMQFKTLPESYKAFKIEISFKPENPNGLILYNGQTSNGVGGDFISFGLNDGVPTFRYNLGSGPAVIRGTKPVKMGSWHTVTLNRNGKNGNMIVDGVGPVVGVSPGRHEGLDLVEPLFLGGVPDFSKINKLNGFESGFVGE